MNTHVLLETISSNEGAVTLSALVGAVDDVMDAHMSRECAGVCEVQVTDAAHMLVHVLVHFAVYRQLTLVAEHFAALKAHDRVWMVRGAMGLERRRRKEGHVALSAYHCDLKLIITLTFPRCDSLGSLDVAALSFPTLRAILVGLVRCHNL
jgi:hypothetical protein